MIKDLDQTVSAIPSVLRPKESHLVCLDFGGLIRKLDIYSFVCTLIHLTNIFENQLCTLYQVLFYVLWI